MRSVFQHIVPVIREIAVAASFVRRQATLLINVHLNKENTTLPTETEKLHSYFTFA